MTQVALFRAIRSAAHTSPRLPALGGTRYHRGPGVPAGLASDDHPYRGNPPSLIGTFAAMAALGYGINNLTLFGLVLAVGIVVDDAIVMVENVERLLA